MGKDEKEEAVEGEEDVQRNEAEKGVEPEHDVIEGMKNMEKGIAPLGEPKPYDDLIHPEEANMKDPGELLLEVRARDAKSRHLSTATFHLQVWLLRRERD
jgi:hypothetical protein